MFMDVDVGREELEEVLFLEVEAVPRSGRSYHAKFRLCGKLRVISLQQPHKGLCWR
jgi:hypothetical protein